MHGVTNLRALEGGRALVSGVVLIVAGLIFALGLIVRVLDGGPYTAINVAARVVGSVALVAAGVLALRRRLTAMRSSKTGVLTGQAVTPISGDALRWMVLKGFAVLGATTLFGIGAVIVGVVQHSSVEVVLGVLLVLLGVGTIIYGSVRRAVVGHWGN